MKKTVAIVLIIVGLLIVVVLGGLFALSRYVQRPEFKNYVLAKTHEQIAVPIEVNSLEVSLFSGFELKGLVVKNPPGSQKESMLKSKEMLFRYRLWPLLRKKVEIETIRVDDLDVVLEKGADGSWNYEKLTREKTPEDKRQATGTASAPKTKTAGAPPSGLAFEIAKLNLADAQILMLKPAGKKLLDVSGLNVQSSLSGGGPTRAARGEHSIP